MERSQLDPEILERAHDFCCDVGKLLRQTRILHGFTLEELANKIYSSPSHIRKVERCKTVTKLDTLFLLVDAMGDEIHISFVRKGMDQLREGLGPEAALLSSRMMDRFNKLEMKLDHIERIKEREK